MPHKASKV